MTSRLAEVKAECGVPDSGPDIAVHIRIGDKLSDAMSRQREASQPGGNAVDTTQLLVSRHIHEMERFIDGMDGSDVIYVYVASDSTEAVWQVRQWALTRRRVHLAARNTHTQNMSGPHVEIAKAINSATNPYNLAEEVILDVALMAEARFFVGICMSQLARLVVSMGTAAGTMEVAVALDHANIAMRDGTKLGDDEGWTPAHEFIKKQ